jgi:hypothetical protein
MFAAFISTWTGNGRPKRSRTANPKGNLPPPNRWALLCLLSYRRFVAAGPSSGTFQFHASMVKVRFLQWNHLYYNEKKRDEKSSATVTL